MERVYIMEQNNFALVKFGVTIYSPIPFPSQHCNKSPFLSSPFVFFLLVQQVKVLPILSCGGGVGGNSQASKKHTLFHSAYHIL